MAYSDFTLEILLRDFGLKARDRVLFDGPGDFVPSDWLCKSLQYGEGPAVVSDKARSEFIFAPILVECLDWLPGIKLFSGASLNVDGKSGLAGTSDFIFARSPSSLLFQWPLMPIVVARKQDIDAALGECVAQMLAIVHHNQRDGKHLPYLFGCVTNGRRWHFLKLQGTELVFHPARFGLEEISRILWFLVECLKDADQASHAA